MKRVLVTGASGLLGRPILKEFRQSGDWEVVGLGFRRLTGGLTQCDLTDRAAVHKVITEFKPDVIVHSAAERRPDIVETDPTATAQINEEATRAICEEAAAVGAWVLYISTDYVFDGKNPPYMEDSEPNPLNKYGVSKLKGEQITLQVKKDNSVLRVPILYGDVESLQESAVTVLFDKVKVTSQKCVMSDYERRYPTHCADVAYVIKELCSRRMQEPASVQGIYHWSGSEEMTKYDMALIMAQVCNLSTDHIVADKEPSKGAPRPYNAQLHPGRVTALGINKFTPFEQGIKEVLAKYAPKA